MRNKTLTGDYVQRASLRVEALNFFMERKGYADVVREAQEAVELLCKALIRHLHAEPARVHDVSAQLKELSPRVPENQQAALSDLIANSRELRRDRELAFYGTEDLTPGEFYTKEDAERALGYAQSALAFVQKMVSTV